VVTEAEEQRGGREARQAHHQQLRGRLGHGRPGIPPLKDRKDAEPGTGQQPDPGGQDGPAAPPRPPWSDRGQLGRRIVEHLLVEARERGFAEVLALTRRSSFFDALGFEVTRRERFIDKLMVDCGACPLNLCCDEIAMVRPPAAPGEFAAPPLEPTPARKEL